MVRRALRAIAVFVLLLAMAAPAVAEPVARCPKPFDLYDRDAMIQLAEEFGFEDPEGHVEELLALIDKNDDEALCFMPIRDVFNIIDNRVRLR